MQILRHSKIAITMEIYTEVPDPHPRRATAPGRPARRLASLYFRAVQTPIQDHRKAFWLVEPRGFEPLTSWLQNAGRLWHTVAELAGPALRCRTRWQVVGACCGQSWWSATETASRRNRLA